MDWVNAVHRQRLRQDADQGFTVAEVLISVTILLFVVISVLGAVQFAAASTRQSAMREQATNIGSRVIEQGRALKFDDLDTATLSTLAYNLLLEEGATDDFDVDIDVEWSYQIVEGVQRATYKLIKVTVAWDRPYANQVELETAVIGKTTKTNFGDVMVKVLEEGTNQPIVGAKVTVTPVSGGVQVATTNSQGIAFIGYVSTGNFTLGVTAEGYVIDVAPINMGSGASVAADKLNSYTVRGKQGSSGAVTVIDQNGAPLQGAKVTISGGGLPTGTSLTTGVDGQVVFSGLVPAAYSVTASATGYGTSAKGTFTITAPGESADITLGLTLKRGLNVYVTQTWGVVPGATVTVTLPSGSKTTATTTDTGVAAFDVSNNGTYTIAVSKSGFGTPATKQVVISGLGVYDTTVSMTPTSSGTLVVQAIDPVLEDDDRAMNGVKIRVMGSNGVYAEGTTVNGAVTFSGLPVASYSVERGGGSAGTGQYWDAKPATIKSGQTTTVKFQDW